MPDQTNGSGTLRVALTQWHASRDANANLQHALQVISEAGKDGADLVLLPENGLFLGTNKEMRAAALAVDGPEIEALRVAAAAAGTAVILGGFKRKDPSGSLYNTALLINEAGDVVGGYDKIHLFDANVGGQSFEASGVEARGTQPVIAIIKGVKVGLTICYDVRFPELYRQLALSGAEVILVPSAFTQTTGQAHWEVLLRSRAIECGAFIIASATIKGTDGDDAFPTYGHALAVDPWGAVLADLGESPQAWTMVSVDLEKVARARTALPVLRGVQPEACSRAPKFLQS